MPTWSPPQITKSSKQTTSPTVPTVPTTTTPANNLPATNPNMVANPNAPATTLPALTPVSTPYTQMPLPSAPQTSPTQATTPVATPEPGEVTPATTPTPASATPAATNPAGQAYQGQTYPNFQTPPSPTWPGNIPQVGATAPSSIPPEIAALQPSTTDISQWVSDQYNSLKKDSNQWGKIVIGPDEKIPIGDWMNMTPETRNMWVQDWFLKLSQAWANTNNTKVGYYTKALRQAGVPDEIVSAYVNSLSQMGAPGTTPLMGFGDHTSPVIQPYSPLAATAVPGYMETDSMSEGQARAALMKDAYIKEQQGRIDRGSAQQFLLDELNAVSSDPIAQALMNRLAAQSSGEQKAISDEQARLMKGTLTQKSAQQYQQQMAALASAMGAGNASGSGTAALAGADVLHGRHATNLAAQKDIDLAQLQANLAFQQQGNSALANWISNQNAQKQAIAGSIANMAISQPALLAQVMPNLPNDIYMATEGNQQIQDALDAQSQNQMFSSALGALGTLGAGALTGGLGAAAITGTGALSGMLTGGDAATWSPDSNLYANIISGSQK